MFTEQPEIQPACCQTPLQQTVLLATSLGYKMKYVSHLTLTQLYKYLSDSERVEGGAPRPNSRDENYLNFHEFNTSLVFATFPQS